MAPVIRRTWSPRGKTPIILQRTRSHQKVSAIAALTLSATGHNANLFFRLHPNINITSKLVIDFIRQLHRHIYKPVFLLWDRFNPHRSSKTSKALIQLPKIHPFFFPPYAPELNPTEYFWSYLKSHSLANTALFELPELSDSTRHHARRIQHSPNLLRAFLAHSPLNLYHG